MSVTAAEKNRDALATILGDTALAAIVGGLRVGVMSDSSSNSRPGLLTAEALGDVLGRLWPAIDSQGPLSETVLRAAVEASASGNKPLQARESWAPPYDVVVILGQGPAPDDGRYVRIGADGWTVFTGAASRFGDSSIPVGPAFAAGLAGAEALKLAFSTQLQGRSTPLIDAEIDLTNFGRPTASTAPNGLLLPRTHVFGVGAVTHGLLWLLERWPGEVSGELLLIDPDSYDVSNGQRYAGMRRDSTGPKVHVKEEILRARFPLLNVSGFEIDGDSYFDQYEQMPRVLLAISGVDSKEMRRHIALKLPRRVINMWTEGSGVGAARFGGGDGWPCMMCKYPEPKEAALDDVTRISRASGLSPWRVHGLLGTGAKLTPQDADRIARHCRLSAQSILGKSIHSVMHEICATAAIPVAGGKRNADVPLAFSSLLSGVAGFINLVQEVSGFSTLPFDWSYDVLDRPHPNCASGSGPEPGCMLCSGGYPSII